MIQLQHVCKTYGEGDNAHHALRNVNLTINDGDYLYLIRAGCFFVQKLPFVFDVEAVFIGI